MELADKIRILDEGCPPPEEAGIFGADFLESEARVVLLPVTWDRTTSYGKGSRDGPAAILSASHQLDLLDLDFGKVFTAGIRMGESIGVDGSPLETLEQVNQASAKLNRLVAEESKRLLDGGKHVGLVGGDHSCPYGLIAELGKRYDDFGILHVDAHHDLRVAYEGYTHSHASIMHNVLEDVASVSKLVSVGVRDFSSAEKAYAQARGERVKTYYDLTMSRDSRPFQEVAQEIVSSLPEKVYVSFDIDGLDPALCPGTGTPVPGGLTFNQGCSLLHELVLSGRKVVGFDLCEVAPQSESEWDANVGARILYKLCGALAVSQNLLRQV